MFFDSIPTDLFRPLASKNARIYGIGLFALYKHLIVNQEHGDECSPAEAKSVIRREILTQTQRPEWSSDEDDQDADTETDLATRVYNRLRATGWLLEIEKIGYKRITSFPLLAAQLLTAFANLGRGEDLDVGSLCQMVYLSLEKVGKSPEENSGLVAFAAKTAKSFYSEAKAISFATREIAHQMNNQSNSAQQLKTFFDEFIGGVFSKNYSTLHSRDNPYRYRAQILSLVTDIQFSADIFGSLVSAIKNSRPDCSHEDAENLVRTDLMSIHSVFTNIHKLLESMEKYRRSMTVRTHEAIRYSYRVTPDLGRKIDSAVAKVSGVDLSNEVFPAQVCGERYVSPSRLYEARVKRPPAEATTIVRQPPPVAEIAYDRALKAYLDRRTDNPIRLESYLDKYVPDIGATTTCELPIESLDEFLAFMEVRKLLGLSINSQTAYKKVLRKYSLSVSESKTTENAYIIAPQLIIQRRTHV